MMRDIKKEELRDILYMYEQTFIGLVWEYEQLDRIESTGFFGLCSMSECLRKNKFISLGKEATIDKFLFKFDSRLFYTPVMRLIAFYKIVNYLLTEKPLDTQLEHNEVEVAHNLLHKE